jgi:exopolysaccharide biosynthesis WecB/TagA/CpsF family protein
MALAPARTLATIDGCPITAATLSAAVSQITERARAGAAFSVFTLNLDHLVKLRRAPAFRKAYDTADIITADGWPVAWMARSQDQNIKRATGADLVAPLVEAAANERLSVFLFGTSPGVIARAGCDLSDRTDGKLDIAGSLAPSNAFDPTGPEADAALEKIKASGAKICLVALGAPKQELFAAYAKSKGIACGFVCIGAALDFLAGEQIRAPKKLQAAGLEWAWRLASNPKRLARRYGECALVFADLLLIRPVRDRMLRARG